VEAKVKRTLSIVLAVAVVGGIVGAVIGVTLDGNDSGTGSGTAQAAQIRSAELVSPKPSSSSDLSAEQIYSRDAPGVVVITDTLTQVVPPTLFSPGTKEQVGALGSGLVIDHRGDIVTNDHVVQGASGVRVGFSSGTSYPATIVGTDPSTDVAVVRVHAPASALHPLSFADSSGVTVGDSVYAIGNPFGLDRTMTAGIVSATDRDIEAPNGLSIPNAIQTDAPINHGNSGGPLLDRLGRVVGINSQIQGGTVNANVGIGFAIPSATAKLVADQLIANGHASHAWLGVEAEAIDPSVAEVVRGLPAQGVLLARVLEDSPAAKAGLRAGTHHMTVDGIGVPLGGDAIVAVDGAHVASPAQLADAVARHKPGDKLTLEVERGGAKRTVHVTLGNAPTTP
jgi:S1-C subfamily serine protease